MKLTTPASIDRHCPAAGIHARTECLQDLALLALGECLQREGYRYSTVTPATHAKVNARNDNAWAKSLEGVFGWNRPFKASLLTRDIVALMQEAGVVATRGDTMRSLGRASTVGDVLFFHSAYPTDDANAVFFGPDSYRFVSAFQHFIDLSFKPVYRAIDIGCGAGPGAITAALTLPEADVLGVDINRRALRLAKVNAILAGAHNARFLYSDVLDAVEGQFDLIMANPPYLNDAKQRAYRNGGGQFGTALSLAIVKSALRHLTPDGTLLLYTGAAIVEGVDTFRMEADAVLRDKGFRYDYREIDPDVFGEELIQPAYERVERIAAVVLTASRSD